MAVQPRYRTAKDQPHAQAPDRQRIPPPVEEQCSTTDGPADEPASLRLLNPNGADIGAGSRRSARTGQSEQSHERGTKSGGALQKHLDLLALAEYTDERGQNDRQRSHGWDAPTGAWKPKPRKTDCPHSAI